MSTSRGGYGSQRSENELIAKVQEISGKIEDAIEVYSQVCVPMKLWLTCSQSVLTSLHWRASSLS